jgi:hypothetical protein
MARTEEAGSSPSTPPVTLIHSKPIRSSRGTSPMSVVATVVRVTFVPPTARLVAV